MSTSFFEPYIGKDYYSNNSKRTLILGSSFYCLQECQYHDECTINSQQFDEVCPYWEKYNQNLSQSCSIELNEYIDGSFYRTYDNFVRRVLKISGHINNETRRKFWQSLSFYNFIQHFLSQKQTPSYWSNKKMFNDCFPAFERVIKNIKPQFIVVWGAQLREAFDDRYFKIYEKEVLKNGIHKIMILHESYEIVFIDHPSSRVYSKKQMELVSNIILL